MLSRENRFSLKTDRNRLETTGQTLHSTLYTVIFAPREERQLPSRFAILVGKKSFPLSVTRHYVKRHVSEAIRNNLAKLPKGLDLILIPKKISQNSTQDEIAVSIIKILQNK